MRLILLTVALISSTIVRGEQIQLSEKVIAELFKDSPPAVQRIQTSTLSSEYKEKLFNENFGFKFNAQSAYIKNNEKPFNAYDQIVSPITSHNISLSKPMKFGAALKASTFSEQASTSMLNDATKSGIGVQLSLDLHKNLFGKITNASEQSIVLNKRKTELQNKIQTKTLLNSIRKLYWSLVANNEAVKISKELLESSIKQANNAKKRFKDSVADRGEVARYESQVSARKASILYLTYQKELLIQKIKEIFPKISSADITLAPYDLGSTINKIVVCMATIDSRKEIPKEFTLYDEMLALSANEYKNNKVITKSYSDWDLKLQSEFKAIGKGVGYSNSFSDLNDNKAKQSSVALSFSIPLGGRSQDVRDVKTIIEKKLYVAEQEDFAGKMAVYHTQVVKNIKLLREVFQNQMVNSKHLEISLNSSKKKYNQARITVENLISTQDAFLSSNLNEIETQLAIITTLLDYFSIFTETPCSINRI